MTHSESINEISTALAKAQGAIEGAVKGKDNPHFRSKYADLGAVWDACREHLSKNGIAVVQPVGHSADGTLCTITRLTHSSGQWMQDDGIPLLLSKQDMQGLGSALTYSRRYGLMSMVGIAPEDDDGNAASQKTNGGQVAQPIKATVPAGFDNWLIDLEVVAKSGIDALKKTWLASKPEYRTHLTKINPEGWESLKAKAAQAEAVPA
jgi:hypothetical protein